MRILIIPDERAVAQMGFARMLRGARARFGADTAVVLGLAAARIPFATDAGVSAEPLPSALSAFETWVVAPGVLPAIDGWDEVRVPGDAGSRQGKRLFLMEPDGFVHPIRVGDDGRIDTTITADDSPHIDRNIFVRMGLRRDRGAAYYFPYNGFYALHPSGFGPINEFGLRIQADLRELERREPVHRVVAVFGGSTTWSPCCLFEEMFPTVLEQRLNASAAMRSQGLHITVLNFGLSGQTVLNQIISYVLFCHRLKPDIVVAHDGFNDLANGIQTDPDLLNRYDITYMAMEESWARTLMGAGHVEPLQPASPDIPIRVLNGPQAVVRAYLARKQQFMRLVQGTGARFVWGLQPAWFAKLASAAERAAFERIKQLAPGNEPLYRAMPMLYELLRTHQTVPPEGNLVDVHGLFSRFGDGDTLFADHAHLTPEGDAKVADLYAEAILERGLPAMTRPRSAP